MANNRFLRKLLPLQALVLAVLLAIGAALPSVEAYADYTYKIRVFSGNQGTISGDDMVEEFLEQIPIGTSCTIQAVQGEKGAQLILTRTNSNGKESSKSYDIKMENDSKYYVKGIRLSGRDNNTALNAPRVTVTQDSDYVIAYGMRGEMVEYTVRYRDKNGKTLLPSNTYYAKDGDKPVVAAPYIEGYFPNTRNLTGTVTKGKDNVWTFIYQRETTGNGGTRTTTRTINRTVNGGTEGGTTGGEEEGADEGEEEGGDEGGDEGGGNLPQTAEDVPDIVDIDDQETPLAEFESQTSAEDETETIQTETDTQEPETVQTESRETIDIRDSKTPGTGFSTPVKIGIGIGILAVIALLLWYFLYKRRNS